MLEEANYILYIDDDSDDLMIFSESIEAQWPGCTVLKAQGGEEGIEILNELERTFRPQPRLIILDMNIPKMDGRQTLKAIRNNKDWEDIPVVIFSTSTSHSDIEFCRNYGAECFTKPMDYKSLDESIQQLLSFCNIPD